MSASRKFEPRHVKTNKVTVRPEHRADAQADLSLRCPHEESWGPWLPIKRTAKTLVRLGGCPGCSESSLGAQSLCWLCHVAAQMPCVETHSFSLIVDCLNSDDPLSATCQHAKECQFVNFKIATLSSFVVLRY